MPNLTRFLGAGLTSKGIFDAFICVSTRCIPLCATAVRRRGAARGYVGGARGPCSATPSGARPCSRRPWTRRARPSGTYGTLHGSSASACSMAMKIGGDGCLRPRCSAFIYDKERCAISRTTTATTNRVLWVSASTASFSQPRFERASAKAIDDDADGSVRREAEDGGKAACALR